MRTRSLDGAVYNEVVDAWMIPQADPFSLANFQAAYDKLAAGKSTQKLSQAQAAEFTPAKKLAPTHYALKIYPKTEEEQWRVEMMEDVNVAYIPFDWVQLSREEAGKVEQSKTRTAANTFAEKSPYTVTHNYTHATDGGSVGPRTFRLPILYTVWPAGKPLPDDLEYVIDYEVFLPHITLGRSLSDTAVHVLFNEVAVAKLGLPLVSLTDSRTTPCSYYGNVRVYDGTLGGNASIANLKVKYQDGSYISETTTDSSGYFSLLVLCYPIGATPPSTEAMPITFTYQDPSGRWVITNDNDVNTPLVVTETFTFQRTSRYSLMTEITLQTGDRRENTIHRAVNYIYNVQTVFPQYSAAGELIIIADAKNGRPVYNGGNFYYNQSGSLMSFSSCAIHMYSRGSDGLIIGDVLHEVGHHFHAIRDGVYNPVGTHDFFKESFACYAGWYLGHEYYTSLGWTNPGGDSDITELHGRQSWTKTSSTSGYNNGWYSPLFIDMTDNYNQSTANVNRPDDDITGVSATAIWNIVMTSYTWNTGPIQQQFRPKIESLVGTSPDFDSWIDNFDNWVGW